MEPTTNPVPTPDYVRTLNELPAKAEAACAEALAAIPASPVPDGWTLLPAGPLKRVRVSRYYLKYGEGPPYLLAVGDGDALKISGVAIQGESRMACDESDGCGGPRTAWVETRAAVLVKE